MDAAHRELLRASKTGLPLALITIDVDHFKRFNDNHGHDAGDTVLREVGKLMSEFFCVGQYPCRIGGEEFVVLCPGTSAGQAYQMAEDFRASISGLKLVYGASLLPSITVSVGVASHPKDGTGVIDLLKAADEALYRAKSTGRDCVMIAGCNQAAEALPVVA